MLISFEKLRQTWQIINRAFRNFRGRFLFIIFLGFCAGLLGGVGISAIIPLFSVLTGQTNQDVDTITRVIEKTFIFFHIPFTLLLLTLFIAVLFVLKAIIQFLVKYTNGKVTAEYEATLRDDIFKKTLNSSWAYLLNQKSGFLERILMNDVSIATQIITIITTIILLGSSLIMYAIVSFNISANVTLLTMAFGAILFFVFKPLYYKIRKTTREMVSTEKTIAHYFSESILNSKAIKASGIDEQVIEKGQDYSDQLRDFRVKAAFYKSVAGPFFEPLGLLFIIGLFIFYHNSPGFNFVSFAAVIYLVQKMFSFIESLQGNTQRVSEMMPNLQAVLDYRTNLVENKEIAKGSSDFIFKKDIVFENVKFSYENFKNIIPDLSFTIKKGEMVGLIGSSGSGKTTIADLFLRLFKPEKGRIMLDGKDIETIDIEKWRKKIGYVSQDVFLLNDTIENNVRFFEKSISRKNIIKAIELANADSFVKKLPKGLNTLIGERGVKLSVGQRQRIALARVLAKNPEILILDEATSSLDNKSELLVQKAIENLKGKVTVLAIAHRLSTITDSDRLLILEKGKVLEEGKPEELLKDKDSHFYKIYNIRN